MQSKIDQFSRADYIFLISYIILWLVLIAAYVFSLLPAHILNNFIGGTGIIVPLFLYIWSFRRLRNPMLSLIWFELGILQTIMMYIILTSPGFANIERSSVQTLVFLPSMIIVYTAIRWIYRLVYQEEMIITAPENEAIAGKEGRSLRPLDYILSIAGPILYMLLPALLFE